MQVMREATSSRWLDEAGRPIACTEKLKLLNDNLTELQQCCADALEDAVLMGCSEKEVRQVLTQMIEQLPSPLRTS